MNKNIKRMFFVLTLITLFATVGAVSAADDANGTTAVDSSVSDVATVSDSASDTLAAEPVQTTSNDNKIDTKTIEKEDKNLKTATKTVEVNNFNEFSNAINNITNDQEIDEGIINLNEGNYSSTGGYYNQQNNTPDIIVNANNQEFYASNTYYYFNFNNRCNITINNAKFNMAIRNNYNLCLNNAIINESITNNANSNLTISNSEVIQSITNNGNLIIKNTTINSTISGNGNVTIDDNVLFGENFVINTKGNIIINDSSRIVAYMTTYNGDYTLENITITKAKTNNGNMIIRNCIMNGYFTNVGNLTIINSTMNNTINNRGNIEIDDQSIADEKLVISGVGNLTCNNSIMISPYMSTYNGNFTLENITINSSKVNNGNLTIRNATINTTITNNGNLTLADDVIFGNNCVFGGNGEIIADNLNKIVPYKNQYNGTYILENAVITQTKTNYGNLTVRNSTLNATLNNYGNLTLENDVIFGNKFSLANIQNGTVIINNTSAIAPYLSTYDGVITLENVNVTSSKSNYGNLTIINCNVTGSITNRGNLIVKNSTMNGAIIAYSGYFIFDDNVIFGSKFTLGGHYSSIIINDTTRISPYITAYYGEFLLENTTISKSKTNNGNLTIRNSSINNKLTNSLNLIIENNSTLNGYLPNGGTMTVRNSTLKQKSKITEY